MAKTNQRKRRSKTVKLTRHRASNQWRKCIGKTIGRQGKVQPKHWYLGEDEQRAEVKALEILGRWKALRLAGKTVWDEDPEYSSKAAETIRRGNRPGSVAEARERYLEEIKEKYDGGQCTKSHYDSQRFRLTKALLPIENTPLELVKEPHLKLAVRTLVQRPMIGEGESERRMSETYAKAAVNSLKWFFEWTDLYGYWKKPNSFKVIFKTPKVVKLDSERQQRLTQATADGPDHFTINELVTIYQAAPERMKLWILLALNCGFCTAELSSLRWYEINSLDTDQAFIERHRGKTDVFAKWWLFPETVQLLRRCPRIENENDLVFMTSDLRTLASANAVGQAWARFLDTIKVSHSLPFKFLRKTGAWLMQQISSAEVAQMYLSQADSRMLRKYTGPDWDKLSETLRGLHIELLPLFELDSVKRQAIIKAHEWELCQKRESERWAKLPAGLAMSLNLNREEG